MESKKQTSYEHQNEEEDCGTGGYISEQRIKILTQPLIDLKTILDTQQR